MGLDMYLIRKKYIGAKWDHNNVKGTIDITINGNGAYSSWFANTEYYVPICLRLKLPVV